MNFGQSFRLALKSLMTSKMRALLTMLGIIIGVGAVIVITSLGNGMQNMMNEQFEKLGANLVQVQLFMYGGDSRSVDPDDMYELVDKYPQYISGVTPYVSAQLAVRQGSEDFERTSIYGVGETFLNERGATMSGQNLGKGRFISYIDAARYQNVCVIGAYLEEEAFQGDALFPQKFTATLLDMLYRVPVILIFSLFVAIVLNQKFKGRGFMRLIFFLPVLVTTGVISSIIKTSLTTVVVGGDSATNIFSAALLTRQLLDAGLPEGLVNTVGGMIANVSDLVWSSGVQILVFLMGLLTIPQSHYEVAQVEGATGWEAFWKVTFPAVSPYILVGLVYSAIDHFIGYDNAVMKYITDNAYNNFRYSYAAAMSWIYFGAILLCLAVLVFITSRFIRYGGADDAPRRERRARHG